MQQLQTQTCLRAADCSTAYLSPNSYLRPNPYLRLGRPRCLPCQPGAPGPTGSSWSSLHRCAPWARWPGPASGPAGSCRLSAPLSRCVVLCCPASPWTPVGRGGVPKSDQRGSRGKRLEMFHGVGMLQKTPENASAPQALFPSPLLPQHQHPHGRYSNTVIFSQKSGKLLGWEQRPPASIAIPEHHPAARPAPNILLHP